MTEKYKLWLHLERQDEDTDESVDIDLPEELGAFATLEEAQEFATKISSFVSG